MGLSPFVLPVCPGQALAVGRGCSSQRRARGSVPGGACAGACEGLLPARGRLIAPVSLMPADTRAPCRPYAAQYAGTRCGLCSELAALEISGKKSANCFIIPPGMEEGGDKRGVPGSAWEGQGKISFSCSRPCLRPSCAGSALLLPQHSCRSQSRPGRDQREAGLEPSLLFLGETWL